ncbi:MAG: ATP-binding protein [Rhodocyclaceae bacterium]|nr:ATP-binding protein [Rhodocyclaceae bacterium]
MSLRQKLLLPLLLLGLAMGGYIRFVWTPRTLAQAEQSQLQSVALQLDSVAEGLTPLLLGNQLDIVYENLAALQGKNAAWADVHLVHPSGRRIYPLAANAAAPSGDNLRRMEKSIAYLGMDLGKLSVLVDMTATLDKLQRQNNELALMLFAMLAIMLFAIVLALELAVRKPLAQLADAARKLAAEDYDAPLPHAGSGEVGTLVASFASMRNDLRQRKLELLQEHDRLLEQIEERKRAEGEVQQLNRQLEQRVAQRTADLEQANKELESFSYSASHDLRTPLRAIAGYSQVLIEDESERLSADGRGTLNRIIKNSNRMAELIDDILDYSRASRRELNRQPVDLDALARVVAAELANDRVRMQIGSLPTVSGDPTMLRQVLQNLIGNAVKFSSQREHAQVDIGCRQENGETVFFVRDNGAGFDMRYAGKLFGMFQRLHAESEFTGTGVGLAIVKRLIERHGGRIWAAAEPDKGATFSFTLGTAAA